MRLMEFEKERIVRMLGDRGGREQADRPVVRLLDRVDRDEHDVLLGRVGLDLVEILGVQGGRLIA